MVTKEEAINWYIQELKKFNKHKMNIVKAIKKPVVITFEKFTGYSDNVKVQDKEDDTYAVYNKLHNSWIGLKIGDYINIENPEDNYPVDAKYFEEHYEIVE